MTRFRHVYGSGPVHLLLMLAGLGTTAGAIATMTPEKLWNPESWWQSIAVWFVIAVIAHDVIAFPAYAAADRVLSRVAPHAASTRLSINNFLRVPSMAAALTFVVFLPGIIRQGGPEYTAATGQTQDPFLTRWLWLTALFYVIAAVVYLVRVALTHRAKSSIEVPPHA